MFSLSEGGKLHTYTVFGVGRLVGIDSCLVGGQHVSTAECMCNTDAYTIDLAEFEHLVETNSAFSKAVMKDMAQETQDLTIKIQDLVFLDVLQRLKYVLIRLAQQHGRETVNGIRINLNLTHEDIAALIAADRSTTTISLNELTRQGYLWRDGRSFIIPPLQHFEILDNLSRSVVEGDEGEAMRWARKAVEIEVDPIKVMGMLSGTMKQVDRGFVRGDLAISDVILAVYATKCALPIIEQELERTRKRVSSLGKIVIGTVQGDIHDLGKTIVSTLLTVAGFEVIDLGVDVSIGIFVEAVESYKPRVLAMSTFLSTTASEPAEIISTLKEEGLRDRLKIIIGGGAMTHELAEQAGGDAYGRTAESAVELAKRLVEAE
jgi:trimethylamine corrinoid protein